MIYLLADAGTADQFKSLVPYIGVPGVIFLGVLFALHKKWLCLGRELGDRDSRIEELKKEKDMWRSEALQNNHQVNRAAAIADRAATVAEKAVNLKES